MATHGKPYAYKKRGCRCEECRSSARRWEKHRAVRLSQQPKAYRDRRRAAA